MINKIYRTEDEYIECFCQVDHLDRYVRYTDNHIKDMYSHNFIRIDHDVTSDIFREVVEKEIVYRKKQGKKYLRVVTSAEIDNKFIRKQHEKVDIECYDYYGFKTEKHTHLKDKSDAKVLCANNDRVNEDGRIVDIIANYKHMELEFAIRRIDRKFEVYSDKEKPIDLYVCYDGKEPVGNCELHMSSDIAKIEDFDIMEIHQKKGYGTFVLKELLRTCYEKGIKEAYLVTDHEDTAKKMYLKCGFELIGNRTEIMYHL